MKKQELTRGDAGEGDDKKANSGSEDNRKQPPKKEGVPRPSRGLGASYGGGVNNGQVDTKNS